MSNPVKKEEEGSGNNKPASMFQMMNHIQSLISMAVENAKQEEKSISHQKSKFSHQTCLFVCFNKASTVKMVELSP